MSIFDCMVHMSAGEKKDSTFIMEKLKEKIIEVDDTMQLTDYFYFDGT